MALIVAAQMNQFQKALFILLICLAVPQYFKHYGSYSRMVLKIIQSLTSEILFSFPACARFNLLTHVDRTHGVFLEKFPHRLGGVDVPGRLSF